MAEPGSVYPKRRIEVAKFSDCLGREWSIRITLGMLPKLREAGFDVNAVAKNPAQLSVLSDPETLGKVAWTLCEKQAIAANVDPEQFADGFDGPTIQDAVQAILESILDFSQPRQTAASVKAMLPGLLAKGEAMLQTRIEAALGSNNGLGDAPESPASTPAT